MDWLDVIQIILLLLACYASFAWGKYTGISGTVEMFLDRKIITEADLEKLL
jgi:hypothetical protein